MRSFLEIYRRFFSGIKMLMFLGLFLVAAESSAPFIVAALGRYTVDEVIQLSLSAPRNRLSAVPLADTRTIETGQLANGKQDLVYQPPDVVSGQPVILAADSANRLTLPGHDLEHPAQITEALLLSLDFVLPRDTSSGGS